MYIVLITKSDLDGRNVQVLKCCFYPVANYALILLIKIKYFFNSEFLCQSKLQDAFERLLSSTLHSQLEQ